jgi:hypothetical protein
MREHYLCPVACPVAPHTSSAVTCMDTASAHLGVRTVIHVTHLFLSVARSKEQSRSASRCFQDLRFNWPVTWGDGVRSRRPTPRHFHLYLLHLWRGLGAWKGGVDA